MVLTNIFSKNTGWYFDLTVEICSLHRPMFCDIKGSFIKKDIVVE
jgi:hypothetical protein